MATRTADGVVRMDINDPKDVQVLVNNGFAWRSGPKTLQRIILLIEEGQVTRAPDKEPPEIAAHLDEVAPLEEPGPELLNPLADEPVEPTVEAPMEPPVA